MIPEHEISNNYGSKNLYADLKNKAPSNILKAVLDYLPVRDLGSFALTSLSNYHFIRERTVNKNPDLFEFRIIINDLIKDFSNARSASHVICKLSNINDRFKYPISSDVTEETKWIVFENIMHLLKQQTLDDTAIFLYLNTAKKLISTYKEKSITFQFDSVNILQVMVKYKQVDGIENILKNLECGSYEFFLLGKSYIIRGDLDKVKNIANKIPYAYSCKPSGSHLKTILLKELKEAYREKNDEKKANEIKRLFKSQTARCVIS